MSEKDSFWQKYSLVQAVNIVIPVFNQLDLVKQCLSSVFAAHTHIGHQVTVVNDASTQPGVATYLRELASRGRIVVIENSENRGFVKSVNDGMRSNPGFDVVLLNSDTIRLRPLA